MSAAMTLFRAALTVGSWTALSRVTGFARDMAVAAVLGAGPVADAFFVAFKLPNLFRRLTGEGAFSAAFVPIFSARLAAQGRAAALAFAGQALSLMLLVLGIGLVAAEIFMPAILWGFAPGFVDDPLRFGLTLEFARITVVYLPLLSLVALLGGMLNATGRFSAMAAAPVLLNLVLIAALFGLAGLVPTSGHALAWGTAAAGLAQFLLLVAACRRAGILVRLPRPRLTEDTRRLFRLMGPAALGAGVTQVNLLIDTILASTLPAGAVSYLYYADRVAQLPLGIVGVALGTALLPILSARIAAGDRAGADAAASRAAEAALLLTLPAAAGIALLASPIVAVLFQRGAFGPAEAAATAAALAAFAAGLPAFVLQKVLVPQFHARQDTATPLRVALVCLGLGVAVSLSLMPVLAHVGLAVSTSVSAWANVGLLGLLLIRRGMWVPDARLRRRSLRILLAVAAMALVLLPSLELAPSAAGLAGQVALGAAAYGGAALLMGAASLAELKGLRRPRLSAPPPSSAPSPPRQ
ncbi:MAG: murein biosynthesis integral membrane protein MurJ [Thalassobaculales bacterium]